MFGARSRSGGIEGALSEIICEGLQLDDNGSFDDGPNAELDDLMGVTLWAA
jgi:hypothetical protein